MNYNLLYLFGIT